MNSFQKCIVSFAAIFFAFIFGYVTLFAPKGSASQFSFFKRFINNPTQVGAIAESSEGLADAITTNINLLPFHTQHHGCRILEVGAGTGVFTQHIIEKMGALDTLDVVEYDPFFYHMLKERFSSYKNVFIHCCSITDFTPQERYDYIVSGLPFNAFPSTFVAQILSVYNKILKPQGTIAYFEYIALPTIKQLGLSLGTFFSEELKKEKTDFDKKCALMTAFQKEFESIEENAVSLNLPPARAVTCHHLKYINKLILSPTAV